MTRTSTSTGQDPETPSSVDSHVSHVEKARRPYRAPTLRKLGSVRELTLGGTMGATEAVGFNNKGSGMM
jgi:hypothetical protein